MEIIGYICATLVGLSLGILGSGGSILTVPIMVYLFNVNPVDATGYSLFVVGISSAIGGIKYIRKKLVDMKTAFIFAVPSIVSVFLTRTFVMPAIPNPVFSVSSFILSKEIFIMVLFAILMVIVSFNMIRNEKYKAPERKELAHINYVWLVTIGFVSGILTGIVGVGGGFIIIPALVLLAKIPVRMSVGTSLLIIAFNCLSGFAGELLERQDVMDYKFLLIFSALAVGGIFMGFSIALKKSPTQIKKLFGWFVLVMGICIFIKEIFIG
ncbi:MAG: sulfite exporter TauE/SafE family protein [Bacteroidia bacterium]|nr:sulfite exporter TauE/SafE family protein [Bacteroidia bacterium]